MIDGRKLYKWIKAEINPYGKPFGGTVFEFGNKVMEHIEAMENQPQADKWIPFEQRKADDEEKEYWLENYGIEIEYMLCGNLPDNDEEILVSCNGHVMTDTFMYDCGECYLDSGCEIIEEATAWMPLPQPYKKEGAESE